ncbi:MAG: ECF transporter S component [Acutalibacteraceae bacterium]
MKRQNLIRGIAVSAVMGAVGFVLMLLEFPLPFIIPSFIKLDFSEIPAIIAAFAFGPQYGILVCLIKNLLHLFVTSSAGVGELSNFLLGAVFTGVAGLIYLKNKNRKGALVGALIGSFAMAAVSVVTNYFVVYPAYVVLYGMPMEGIIGMYQAILPASDNLLKCLLIFNLPFTFIKGIIDAGVCFAVYKRISPILKYGLKK